MASPTKVQSLEKAALRLKPSARARLVHTLVGSLGGLSREQMNSLWLDEAERRHAELKSGKVAGVSGDEVFARIKAKHIK